MTEEEAATVITRFAKRMYVKVNTKQELQSRFGKKSEFLNRVKIRKCKPGAPCGSN